MYHHIIFINICNKVINHVVEESNGEYKEKYSVVFSKDAGVFRVSYYTNNKNKKEIENYILSTFRDQTIERK